MQAVKSQVATNEAAAASFFARVQTVVTQHIESQKKESQTQEAVEHLLLLAPLLRVVKEHVEKRSVWDVGRGGVPEAARRHHCRREDRFHILCRPSSDSFTERRADARAGQTDFRADRRGL